MSPYVCDCTNVVYMFCVYCIYYYVNKFEARSSFSTSHLDCNRHREMFNVSFLEHDLKYCLEHVKQRNLGQYACIDRT